MIKFIKQRDWLVRALKTFVQAFGAILVPEIVALLNGGLQSIESMWLILAPVLMSALAAGIAAVWNIILEELKKEPDEDSDYIEIG